MTPALERAEWERQYASGQWDRLETGRELARHAVIADFIHSRGMSSVLDLGCGAGALYEALGGPGFPGLYLGVDWSLRALLRTSTGPRHSMVCADIANLPVRARFDAVVLNEVLYYLDDPVAYARALFDRLMPGGLLIVSVYQPGEASGSRWLPTVRWLDTTLRTRFSGPVETREVVMGGGRWVLYFLMGGDDSR